MLCLSGFKLYSRWVPLKHTHKMTGSFKKKNCHRQICFYCSKSRNFIGKYYFPVGFQPMNNFFCFISKQMEMKG